MRPQLALSVALVACSGSPPIQNPTCDAGTMTACGGECVDLQTSTAHCGACGTACTGTQSCVGGACFDDTCAGSTCAASQICSSNHCTERACVGVSCGQGQGCLNGSCVTTSCGGTACPNGQVCINNACADASCFGVVCPSGETCSQGACGASHCSNGMLDGDETDVDCGGSCPNKCTSTQGCMGANDCTTGSCSSGHCSAPASCSDGRRDGTETDVDCGGAVCTLRCSTGSGCLGGGDCTSGTCTGGVCAGASCNDGKKNGTESDTDCGGACTQKCSDGQHCLVPADCTSMTCMSGTCAASSCSDGMKDGSETDVDCGGGCPLKCSLNDHCMTATDCTSMSCMSGTCAGPTCFDNAKNGTESDVDCGGSCAQKCNNGQHCNISTDCVSMSCLNGLCGGSSCADQVKNGSETDVDCGGSCSPCSDGLHCSVPQDCRSGVCTSGTCAVPTCSDMVKNGSETDVDCGGSCPNKCADGQQCSMAADCLNGMCSGLYCESASCFDSMKDGNETDIDCGGACARKCIVGQGCAIPGDCASGICAGTTCGGDPLYSGLLGWWPLNAADIANNIVVDASGNGNSVTLVGGFASAAGKIGGAVQFTTASSYIAAGNDINPGVAFTLSAWVNAMPTSGYQQIIDKWNTEGPYDGDQSFYLQITPSGYAQCGANGLSTADHSVTGSSSVLDGNWHLVTCTVDRNAPGANFILYVDGAQKATATVGTDVVRIAPDPMIIGAGINGMLDDVRIYGQALAPSDVLTLYSATYPGVPAPPGGLTAHAVSGSEIDLSWGPSTSMGVTGYMIQRSLSGTNGWFPIAVVNAGTTSYVDVMVPGSTKLYYRVLAQSATGSSSPTATANATTLAGYAYSLPTGLMAYWTGNSADVTSVAMRDATDGGANAVLMGTPMLVSGKIGEAVQTDAMSFFSVSNAPEPSTGITLSAWVKTTQTTTANIFNRWNVTGPYDQDQAFLLRLSNQPGSGAATVYLNGPSTADHILTGSVVVNDGQWHLVTATGDRNAFGNNMKIYIDGALDRDIAVGTDLVRFTTDPLNLGDTFVGAIDDLRIYGRGLTSYEVRALYANGSMGSQ